MHVIIVTDLEGISGVDSIEMIPEKNEGYRRACEYLMADTNAAVDGAFLGGATKVTVLDGHGGGRNFIDGMLDPRAEIISAEKFCREPLEGYDAVMCVGAHAMAGTQNAFLDHTEDSTAWFEYCLNGTPVGEVAIVAYAFGTFGTPLVMASGDAATCWEVQQMFPDAAVACVKDAKERNRANCLPQEEALARIREAAKEGVRCAGKIAPSVLQMPVEVKITHTRNDYCDHAAHPGVERNGRTIRKLLKKINTYMDLLVL